MDDLPKEKDNEKDSQDKQHCLNCNAELIGRFCSSCGQDSRPLQRSVGRILSGVAERLFDLDGRILKTIIPILISPGKLTLDYLDGKRRAQVNPFQLYAFFSFLFFLSSIYLPAFFERDVNPARREEISLLSDDSLSGDGSMSLELIDSDLKVSSDDSIDYEKKIAEFDSDQASLPEEQRDGFFGRFIKKRFYHFAARLKEEKKTLFSEISDYFKDNIPNTLILLLPVFAFFLKLFYLRNKFYFVDHLIFSIHLFCFLFLVGTIYAIAAPLISDAVGSVVVLAPVLYFIVAMKRVYHQAWGKTILKFFLISFLFSIVLVVALALNFLFAIFFQV